LGFVEAVELVHRQIPEGGVDLGIEAGVGIGSELFLI
jgi:hypothetical protein